MAKIVISAIGTFGDIHPPIALGIELKRRGHDVILNVMENYRDKIERLGFPYKKLSPNINLQDKEFYHQLMDTKRSIEKIYCKQIQPFLTEMFHDVSEAVKGADILITSSLVIVGKSVVEKTGIKWISMTYAPVMFFSSFDPSIYPNVQWLGTFRFMPALFHKVIFTQIILRISGKWLKPYKKFRRELGLNENHDPITEGNHSTLLHLALFSRILGKPQPDWCKSTIQTGFCFFDEQNEYTSLPKELYVFLESDDPPIIFTLGSAAIMDSDNFFEESIKAVKLLERRAILLYGTYNDPPRNLNERIIGYPYAPYALLFPRALCIVHQGGVGTTAQAIRAGIPQLIVPFCNDQPDNAARCKRIGVAEVINRNKYTVNTVAKKLHKIIRKPGYRKAAKEHSQIVNSENGVIMAGDAIENIVLK